MGTDLFILSRGGVHSGVVPIHMLAARLTHATHAPLHQPERTTMRQHCCQQGQAKRDEDAYTLQRSGYNQQKDDGGKCAYHHAVEGLPGSFCALKTVGEGA